MTKQEKLYDCFHKIATRNYYEALCKYVGFSQKPHNKDQVIYTYVDILLAQTTDDMSQDEVDEVLEKAHINMLYEMYESMVITRNGRTIAEWDDRKGGRSSVGLVAGAIGLLLGISLF